MWSAHPSLIPLTRPGQSHHHYHKSDLPWESLKPPSRMDGMRRAYRLLTPTCTHHLATSVAGAQKQPGGPCWPDPPSRHFRLNPSPLYIIPYRSARGCQTSQLEETIEKDSHDLGVATHHHIWFTRHIWDTNCGDIVSRRIWHPSWEAINRHNFQNK